MTVIPAHQWTHEGDRVLLVKCVNADLTSYRGFRWPESGPVESPNWSPEPTCNSGGLFGWPWGIVFGDGKEPDYTGRWIVFAAEPAGVVDLGGKCKVQRAEVVYCGTWYGALSYVRDGQRAWIEQAAEGKSSATGDSSASSATGNRSASSATGDRSASSATGYSSASSATGYSSASSATGYRSASSATGDRSASSATGNRSIAAVTGFASRVEAGDGGLAVCTADECYWRVRAGAIFVQRWATYKRDGDTVSLYHTTVIDAADYADGDLLHIKNGKAKKVGEGA